MQRHIELLFRHIETKQRFCIDDNACLEVLDIIERTSANFLEEKKIGDSFFRAQRGCILKKTKLGNGNHSWVATPFGKKRMVPLPE